MPNFMRIAPFWSAAAEGAALRTSPIALRGSDPDGFDVEVFLHLLNAGFAAIAAHLVATKRYGRVHCLIAIDPHRAGTQSLREPVRLADIARPHTAAEPKSGGVAAAHDFVDIGERDRRYHRTKDFLLRDPHVVTNVGVNGRRDKIALRKWSLG